MTSFRQNLARLKAKDISSVGIISISTAAIFILCLNLVFFIKLFFAGNLKYQGSALEISGAVAALPEITYGSKVSQTFVVDHNGFSSVAVQVGTYMRRNDVQLVLTVTDQVETVLRSKTFSLLKHSDNSYLKFSFDPIWNSKGKTMILSIESPDSKTGNAVTLWTTGSDVYPQGKLRVNDKYLSSDLVLSVKYVQ